MHLQNQQKYYLSERFDMRLWSETLPKDVSEPSIHKPAKTLTSEGIPFSFDALLRCSQIEGKF